MMAQQVKNRARLRFSLEYYRGIEGQGGVLPDDVRGA